MKKKTLIFAKWSLALVYLVILAGAIVRMTGSGMGCPDWPKCFGYLIPPTDEIELEWQPGKIFEKGQVIVREETLLVAQKDFTTGQTFDPTNWEVYDKHDYAVFNVWHTWIEYLNRLLGALAGLATLGLLISSLWWGKTSKVIPIVSLLVVIGMGFQAWLGATVVYSLLAPFRITLHMLMALVIVGLLIFLIFKLTKREFSPTPTYLKYTTLITLIITLTQVVMGTQVRQFVDHQIDLFGESAKNLWLNDPSIIFYIHRSFSILVLVLNGWLWWQWRRGNFNFKAINWVMGLIGIEIATGMAMYYIDFPFGSQPLHLVISSLLFGVQFLLLLQVFSVSSPLKSL